MEVEPQISIKDCISGPICLGYIPAYDNLACHNCYQTYCKNCIAQHLRNDGRCPNCRKEITIDQMTKNMTLDLILELLNKDNSSEKRLTQCSDHQHKAYFYGLTGQGCLCLDGVIEQKH